MPRSGHHAGEGGKGQPISFRHHLTHPWSPAGAPVLVVGDSMLDVYVLGAVERISPEAPVPVIRQQAIRETAGGAANVAVNIVGLGGNAHLVACVGADHEGQRLASVLMGASVTCDLIPTPAKPTTVKTRFATGQHQLLRLDREDASPIAPDREDAILAAVARRIETCRVVVMSDYNKGMLTDRVLAGVIALGRARGVPVIVDPKRRDFGAYRGATYLKPNRAELHHATGLPVASDAEVERAGAAAAAATDASILVTRSESGMSLVKPDGTAHHMPTHAQHVYDVTGAGDTVIAAFALGLAGHRTVDEAMAFANLAGGIAVSKPGTAIVQEEELEAERSLLADDEVVPKGGLVNAETAARLRRIWKRQGLVVGFTNGCFDLIHPGHVSLLQGAAQACDRLIIGLNSDASVRRLKGSTRPVQGEEARAAVLGAIGHVNLVVLFEEDTPIGLIEQLQPDLLVKGADYTIDKIVGADIVQKAGGRVMTVDLVPGQSTTRLIESGSSAVLGTGKVQA
jgi:D-beta-D-heptose 7-phosphate kinase/D-beta-D-heptose 1-phosphate adenosyltransferase